VSLGLIAAILLALPAMGQSAEDLRARGFEGLDCTFRERCVMGAPCVAHWQRSLWFFEDGSGLAYRQETDGRMRRGMVMQDSRWKELSRARAIVMPLREQVASQLTVFHDGGAILSVQYAADPGSGQFLTGACLRDPDPGSVAE
jgi:hypothetical protein